MVIVVDDELSYVLEGGTKLVRAWASVVRYGICVPILPQEIDGFPQSTLLPQRRSTTNLRDR